MDSQKLYYNMKYHANQVSEYGNKLSDEGAASLFAKAKETGSNTEIVANIKGFVSQYNSMLENLRESGTRTDNNYLTQLNSISSLKSSELAACGVSRQSDGTLVVDDKKLGAAGLESLGRQGRHWQQSIPLGRFYRKYCGAEHGGQGKHQLQ